MGWQTGGLSFADKRFFSANPASIENDKRLAPHSEDLNSMRDDLLTIIIYTLDAPAWETARKI